MGSPKSPRPLPGDRLIVRRVRNLGEQAQLFPTWRYHAIVTDRVGTMLKLDADHRRHAVLPPEAGDSPVVDGREGL
jgi:hypothetical protein